MFKFMLIIMLGLLPLTANAKTLVVLGDSISAAYGLEVQQGWVALLQKKLHEQHDTSIIYNEGISGDTTAGGLGRVDQILQHYKPDIVLLELGANDGLRGLSATAMHDNLQEIIKRCRKAGAEVLLLGMKIPPNYGVRYIDMFYQVYPQLARELKLSLVPFILEDVALKPELMQADGLHPNALAQPTIADKIWPYLQAMGVGK